MATVLQMKIYLERHFSRWSVQIFKMATVCSPLYCKQIFKMAAVCSPLNTNIQNGSCLLTTQYKYTKWQLCAHHVIQIFKMATVCSKLNTSISKWRLCAHHSIKIFKMAAVCSPLISNIQNGDCLLTTLNKYSKWWMFIVCSPFNTNIQNGGCTQSECTYNGYLLLGARTLLFYIDILHLLTQIFTRGYTLYVDIR